LTDGGGGSSGDDDDDNYDDDDDKDDDAETELGFLKWFLVINKMCSKLFK